MVKLFPTACGTKIEVRAGFKNKDKVKRIPGRTWNQAKKVWEVPIINLPQVWEEFPEAMAHPSVEVVYAEQTEHLQKAVNAKHQADAERQFPGLKGTLYPFQAVGRSFLGTLRPKEGAILGFDMGLGKTITALAEFVRLYGRGELKRCLVVCPASLKYATWEKELNKWTELTYQIIDGDAKGVKVNGKTLRGKPLRKHQYQQDAVVLVTNYESFLHDKDAIPTLDDTWCLILDEAHRIKNPKAKTTKNLFKKGKQAGRKFLLTGTPLENSVTELWSLVDMCRPGMLGPYSKFKDRYIIEDYWGNEVSPNHARLPELREKLEPITFRKRKEDALPDLPPLVEQEYWVYMTPDQKKLYTEIQSGIVEMTDGDFTYMDILAQLTRLQQVLDSPALLRDVLDRPDLPVDSGKLTELDNVLRDVGENKAIVFSQYRTMADILYARLCKTFGNEAVRYISGNTATADRGTYQNEFQDDDRVRFIVITTAGNYGLDLYRASYVICYDQLFNPQKMSQVLSRAHRNGAQQKVTAVHLVTKDSYEERKLKILDKKKRLFNAMIDVEDFKLTPEELRYLLGD